MSGGELHKSPFLTRHGLTRQATGRYWAFCRNVLFSCLLSWTSISQSQEAPAWVVYGGDASFPPFEWLNEGSASGLNVDILASLAEQGGSQLEFRLGTWPDTLAALQRGEVDVVAFFPSSQYSSDFLFTSPIKYVHHAVYGAPFVRPLEAVEDLLGQRVSMEQYSAVPEQFRRERIRVQPVITENVAKALQALMSDEAEYAVLPTPTADHLIHQLELPVQKLLPSVWPSAYSFAVHHSQPELFNWLQHNLDQLTASGQFQAVQAQWHPAMEFTTPRDPRQVMLFILGLISFLLLTVILILIWSWRLRRRVADQSEELQRSEAQARAAESQARHYADYDSTTDLPKEHEFIRQVDHMLSNKNRTATQELRLIKLTPLNEVIKVLGREYAEQLLRRFADTIRQLSQGNPCGYLGRGVYALCHEAQAMPHMFDTALSSWGQKDEKIRTELIGGSAYWPEHGQSGADLIQRAETALSTSRSTGKAWTAYSPEMEPEADTLAMVSSFRANELEGLTAVYQPQIDLRSGSVVAAEALVRWRHPTLGNIAPSRFIPLIEKAGLVSQVTSYMLGQAAQMSASLRADNLPSMISVNITISDLMESDFPELVERILGEHGALASDLKLELTETSAASDLKHATHVLHQLHDIGISLSVDDFGTGYSSFSYLSAFPVQEVKIDRHFVFDMVRNSRNRSIVRSTILMARELGLQTVAEGAEDRATLEVLAEYSCDRVQGYVFSPPLVESRFREFARKYRARGLL